MAEPITAEFGGRAWQPSRVSRDSGCGQWRHACTYLVVTWAAPGGHFVAVIMFNLRNRPIIFTGRHKTRKRDRCSFPAHSVTPWRCAGKAVNAKHSLLTQAAEVEGCRNETAADKLHNLCSRVYIGVNPGPKRFGGSSCADHTYPPPTPPPTPM